MMPYDGNIWALLQSAAAFNATAVHAMWLSSINKSRHAEVHNLYIQNGLLYAGR